MKDGFFYVTQFLASLILPQKFALNLQETNSHVILAVLGRQKCPEDQLNVPNVAVKMQWVRRLMLTKLDKNPDDLIVVKVCEVTNLMVFFTGVLFN
ncbi:hypothetical protein llap_5685 [Limosa lapponica baueri]|uniref:Uncharacterized protein n=1 Tax=Limosa lapponica baueri TaxID=1758121 RepID=A0A2I0UD93_LIMLA|nr:hypothetical protein llap_5685 [Limosa lapponica baueri]